MSRTIHAGEALGTRRMRAIYKDEVIAFLAAADVDAPQRRRWYREWCAATGTKVRPEDLANVAPPRPRPLENLNLFSEG